MRYIVFAAVLLAASAPAGEISFDFSLPRGVRLVTEYAGGALPECPGGLTWFDEGQPNLPVVTHTFVIPQGMSVTGAEMEIVTEAVIDGFHNVLPVRVTSRSFLKSGPNSRDSFGEGPGPFLRDPGIYLSDEVFPASPVVATCTGTRTGFQLGSVSISPFSYNPLSGRLSVITEARITLSYSPDPAVERLCLTEGQIGHARAILENIVDNPRDLEACRPEERETDDSWPVWVAIGPASIEATLQPLVDHRNSTGLEAAYVTLDSIYANYTGYDTQEQIRNYLKHAYENQGLIYALIVGDWGPTQRISSLVVGGDSLMLAQTADLYFSDLTRMWDGDGDHLYGENTDWIDYYSDITVGRFSSDVQLHIATMVSKAIAYETESAEGAWRTTALLCGAGLWPDVEPDGYWGSFVCDSISKRIPPSWTQIRRYESRSGHPNDQIDIINRGASYVSDQGHGGPGGVYWYYSPGNMFTNQNYTGMSNSDKLTIFHSMACDPGMLSVNGCSAERLMMWPDGGAVAVMYNSNYGWGTPPSVGPSEWLEIHFANQLFVFGIQRIGDMQAAAKDAFKAAGGMILQNWVLQENNYLGDPAEVFVSRQTGIEGGQQSPESGTLLGPASPNPARGAFSVSWSLPGPAVFDATLEMYDLSGRRVWSCDLQAGSGASGTVMVPGTDGTGTRLPSGCYLLRLDSSSGSAASMVVLLGK